MNRNPNYKQRWQLNVALIIFFTRSQAPAWECQLEAQLPQELKEARASLKRFLTWSVGTRASREKLNLFKASKLVMSAIRIDGKAVSYESQRVAV